MKKAHVYSTFVNGTPTQVKAYNKQNAFRRLQQLDTTVKFKDVHKTNFINSHQAPVEECYPELFN